ncbi:MAG: GNAT family N-acetyltransferase [Lachnospiraceae bacterium]|nr:GNAT family N-acetyltransferase [Lachnospiraceae bacterium]
MENMENKNEEQLQTSHKHVVKTPKVTIIATDDNDIWNADWNIYKTDNEEEKIGVISFAGEKVLGTIPIHLEIEEQYRNQGYGSDVVAAMSSWLFHFKNIYEIKAETDRENDKAVKVLKKNGFVFRDGEGRTEYYSRTKPKTAWTGLYLFLGIFLGFILGIVFSHIVTGMIIGIVIGVSIGLSLDSKANKEREKVTGKQLK